MISTVKTVYFSFFALLFCAALLVTGCNAGGAAEDNTEELIAQSWKMKSMTDHGEQAPMQVIIFSSFTFNKNGTYEILLGEVEKGNWTLSEDKKVLYTTPTGSNQRNEMDIESIDERFLILTNINETYDQDVRMVLEPML